MMKKIRNLSAILSFISFLLLILLLSSNDYGYTETEDGIKAFLTVSIFGLFCSFFCVFIVSIFKIKKDKNTKKQRRINKLNKEIENDNSPDEIEKNNDDISAGKEVNSYDEIKKSNKTLYNFRKENGKMRNFKGSKLIITILSAVSIILSIVCIVNAFRYQKLLTTYNDFKVSSETKYSELEGKYYEVTSKLEEAKPWFEMKEEEKEKLLKEQERKKHEEEQKREKEEQERKRKIEEEEKIGFNTGITYQQLAREPEKYKNKKIKFRGKIVQVIENQDVNEYRMAVGGDYSKVILLTVNKNLLRSSRILEEDSVTVYGYSLGVITYESTLGGNVTVPAMDVEKIDR